MNKDTIAAIATPPGKGGVGVIRVSGNLVAKISKVILGKVPKPRFAFYGQFSDSKSSKTIDQGIAIYFKAPNSFTGEDVLELHTHGSPVVLDEILENILNLGARLANPGEFSERAFLNNKIDLAQAEAIADLIDATSRKAAQNAFRSLQGSFSSIIDSLVNSLIELRLRVEGAIDFAEEDIDFIDFKNVKNNIDSIIKQIIKIEKIAKQGVLLNEGANIVIVGKPNVGKSSLLNKLSEKDLAIVTDIPGTTRDVICANVKFDGISFHLSDTAGIHESKNVIESEGIKRAYVATKDADIILIVVDISEEDDRDVNAIVNKLLPEISVDQKVIVIFNKIDLINDVEKVYENGQDRMDNISSVYISIKENIGIDLLKELIKEKSGYMEITDGFSARRRHLKALNVAKTDLLRAKKESTNSKNLELIAEDLRGAQNALNEITGAFTTDDLLGKIFSEFCVGK